MDWLIVEPLGSAVLRWLDAHYAVRFVPEYADDRLGLRAALAGVSALVLPPAVVVDDALLAAAPRLRAIGRVSAGAENIDFDACRRAGVQVVRSPDAADPAEAEFVIGALLSMLRRLPVGRELGAATVGVLGVSAATEHLTRRLAAFGCTTIGYDPSLHASDRLFADLGIRPVGLVELFARSDAVCVQLGDFSRYRGLIGERLLQAARQDQVIVCTSSSAVFDEIALATALADGPLAGAWLDSLRPGARDEGHPLHGIGRLQITPRVATTTRESRLRSAWAVARRIDELLRGPAPAPPERPDPAPEASVIPAPSTAPAVREDDPASR